MKHFTTTAMTTLFAGVFATTLSAEQMWDLPLAWPAENYISVEAAHFGEEVAKVTNGEVKITTHPGGSLGFKGPEMFAAARDGLVPITDMLLQQQVGDEPLLGLQSLPFLMTSYEEQVAFQEFYRPLLEELFAENNQKLLYTIPWPQQQVWTKKEINSFEDFAGIKVRSSDPSATEIFAAAGMTPVQLPWGEVIPSLATGAIEGVGTSSPSAVDGSFWEFLTHGYPTRHTWNLNATSVNLDAWNALTPESQAAIEALAKEMEPGFWQAAQDADAAKMQQLAENGMTLGDLSDEIRAELRSRAEPIRTAALDKMGERAKAVVEAFASR
ncbi:MAG TPA: C4-dicarboxylate ABC transporter substrate-binding protein [Roseovarius nubinhibens]|uniref:C4-dicarboxylate ABC transporter substrate-binding protein n=1 Tax=Roseovarius nubinhibens TaxID=314263 RepID=A0A348W9I5_9RHOB|nr:C4-dicarboxylate ABC transporter substrate-binding protein [Roseovarius nubinhibens]|tara:strand:+ start:16659 stop:17639 length:981 start_codon:yes stop_codon:yes gene_type:complete